ncbi:MAG: PTS sugar transporter subunit IIA [Planctomycetota bacterium]|jgi:fructose-specific phosphotransferase system IIA component
MRLAEPAVIILPSIAKSTMKITDILSPKAVTVPLVATEKKAVIDELVDLLDSSGLIDDPGALKQVVWEREQQRSTGIGDGLAIPHGKSSCSKNLVMAVGRPANPIDFEAVDGKMVELVVLLASPPDRTADHIQALGKISRLLSDRNVRSAAYSADSAEALYQLFKEADR